MLFSFSKSFFEAQIAPRPIISLFFILISIIIFIIFFGVTYYYGYIFSLTDQELKTNLLFAVPSILWFFYYGIQLLYSIFNESLSLDYILISSLVFIFWFISLRLITLTNNSSYAKQQIKTIIEDKLSKDNKTNDIEEFFLLFLVYIPFYFIPWILDILLQLFLLFLQIIFLLLILKNISIINFDSTIMGTVYDFVFNEFSIPTINFDSNIINIIYNFIFNDFNVLLINYIEQLAFMQSPDYYFLIIVLLILSWISFRQSGVPSMMRVFILVSSITILLLSAYQYGNNFGKNTLRFWNVTIEQNNKTVSICKEGCALLAKTNNHAIVLDVKENELHDLTGLKLNIHFTNKKTLDDF